MENSALEKFIKERLVEYGFKVSEFGVISADYPGGSCNLTYVIADIIEACNEQKLNTQHL